MNSGGISVRRRQFMLAGTASVVAPTVSFAFPASAAPAGSEMLLVSGRIVDASGKPVAGALVEMASPAHSATTDGDGRFMLKTRVSRRDEYVDYRVSGTALRPAHKRLRVAYGESSGTGSNTLLRDEQGVWRTTCTVTLA